MRLAGNGLRLPAVSGGVVADEELGSGLGSASGSVHGVLDFETISVPLGRLELSSDAGKIRVADEDLALHVGDCGLDLAGRGDGSAVVRVSFPIGRVRRVKVEGGARRII